MRALLVAAIFLAQGPGGPRIASGVITGEIRAIDSSPAVGVRVSALAVPENGATAVLASLAQSDSMGRFRLEDVPPGRYYITAGPLDFSSYYPGVKTQAEARVITVTIGATISGINFTLARSTGFRVSGRVNGLPRGGPAGLVRATLTPQPATASTGPIDALVQPDGTFEFLKVLPGRYLARLTPITAGTSQIQVDDMDVTVNLTMPPNLLFGRVIVDNGAKLPVQMAAIAAGTPDPPSLVRLMARRITPVAAGAAGAARGGAPAGQVNSVVRADGFFLLPNVAPGEYQVMGVQLPFGYFVKSVALDQATAQLQVVLTTTPPVPEQRGVKVSGRVVGAGMGNRWVTLQMSASNAFGLAEQRIGESPIRNDGTFEILSVPSGRATIQVASPTGSVPPTPLQMQLEVGDRDIFIEFAITRSESPAPGTSSGTSAQPVPLTFIMPDAPDSPSSPPGPPPPAILNRLTPPLPVIIEELPVIIEGGQRGGPNADPSALLNQARSLADRAARTQEGVENETQQLAQNPATSNVRQRVEAINRQRQEVTDAVNSLQQQLRDLQGSQNREAAAAAREANDGIQQNQLQARANYAQQMLQTGANNDADGNQAAAQARFGDAAMQDRQIQQTLNDAARRLGQAAQSANNNSDRQVQPAQNLLNQTGQIITGVSVRGRVSGPTPGNAAAARLISLTQNGRTMFQSPILSDGVFAFTGVPPGTYSVHLSLTGEYFLFDALVVGDKDVVGFVVLAPGP